MQQRVKELGRKAECPLVVLVMVVAVGWVDAGASVQEELLAHLGGSRADCPAGVEALGDDGEAVCGRVDLEPKRLRKRVARFMRVKAKTMPASYLGAWDEVDGYRRRGLTVGSELFWFHVRSDGAVVMLPPPSCLESTEGLARTDDPGVSVPEPLDKPHPAFPEQARIERRSGVALLNGIVERDGTLSHVCIAHVQPRGLGFEQSALQTVSRWRYEPGLRDGRPVRFFMSITVQWQLWP